MNTYNNNNNNNNPGPPGDQQGNNNNQQGPHYGQNQGYNNNQQGYYQNPNPSYDNYNQAPNYGPGPQPGYYPPNMYPVQPKTNTKSIVALVLGILGIVIPYIGMISAIVGLIFAILAFKEIKKSNGYEQGKGLAIAGLVCSILSLLLYSIIIIFIIAFAFYMEDSYYDNVNYILNWGRTFLV